MNIKDFFSKCDQICQHLVTFTKETLNGKLHFMCNVVHSKVNCQRKSQILNIEQYYADCVIQLQSIIRKLSVLTYFMPLVLYTSENIKVFDIFKGYRKGPVI